jgi:hypothetical protein
LTRKALNLPLHRLSKGEPVGVVKGDVQSEKRPLEGFARVQFAPQLCAQKAKELRRGIVLRIQFRVYRVQAIGFRSSQFLWFRVKGFEVKVFFLGFEVFGFQCIRTSTIRWMRGESLSNII